MENLALMAITMYSVMVIYGAYELFVLKKIRHPMKVQVFHLFFKSDGNGGLLPADPELHSLAVNFAAQNLAEPIDFTVYKNTWIACETDQDRIVRVVGVLCMMLRPDFPICRFVDNAAVVKLVQRANDHMHDMYGWRGLEALIHIKENEPPEARCTNYRDWMEAFGLKPADRWTYKVR